MRVLLVRLWTENVIVGTYEFSEVILRGGVDRFDLLSLKMCLLTLCQKADNKALP